MTSILDTLATETGIGSPVGMTYGQALTKLIDDQYAQHVKSNSGRMAQFLRSRDEFILDYTVNIPLSAKIMGQSGVGDTFYQDARISYGVFDNCREYGLTVTAGDWTFAVYEHRNSDNVCIEGCLTAEMPASGPYGTDDKYDTIASFQYDVQARTVSEALSEMLTSALDDKATVTREHMKAVGRAHGGMA